MCARTLFCETGNEADESGTIVRTNEKATALIFCTHTRTGIFSYTMKISRRAQSLSPFLAMEVFERAAELESFLKG